MCSASCEFYHQHLLLLSVSLIERQKLQERPLDTALRLMLPDFLLDPRPFLIAVSQEMK
jgi:hypothetical protein